MSGKRCQIHSRNRIVLEWRPEGEFKLSQLLSRVADSFKNGDLVLLVGAGVSIPRPSNLPSAARLMKAAIRTFCRKYETYFDSLKLRPEVLFGIVERHEQVSLYQFLKNQLSGGPSNSNHTFFAQALLHHNSIITTNFDCLIERACKTIGVEVCLTVGESESEVEGPLLFKIHGSIENRESLQVTMNHANRGLSVHKLSLLRSLTKDKLLLVLGYSGCDQLDIMPALATCQYKEIIWISHDTKCGGLANATSDNPYISSLVNLSFIRSNTSIFVNRLAKRLKVSRPVERPLLASGDRFPRLKVDKVNSFRIAVDILMQQNDYERAYEIVSAYGTRDSLFGESIMLRLLHLRNPKDPSIPTKRTKLTEHLESLEPGKADLYYPILAQYAAVGDQLYRVASILKNRLEESDSVSENLLEACLELSFRLINVEEFDSAEFFIEEALKAALERSDLLLEARSNILLSALIDEREAISENKSAFRLRKAVEHADRAIFLLEKDIFSDEYYQCQAKNNKAEALVMLGEYEEAVPLYQDAARYYENKDVRSFAQILSNLSELYMRRKSYDAALSTIDRALEVADRGVGGRSVAIAHRRKAQILKEGFTDPHCLKQARYLLENSIRLFEQAGSFAEAQEARRALAEFG